MIIFYGNVFNKAIKVFLFYKIFAYEKNKQWQINKTRFKKNIFLLYFAVSVFYFFVTLPSEKSHTFKNNVVGNFISHQNFTLEFMLLFTH